MSVRNSGTFTFSSPDPSATFLCTLDGGAWAECSSPYAFSALPEGTHQFQVQAIDTAGNYDPSPVLRTWTIDLTDPMTTITAGPDAVTVLTAASFSFDSPDGAAFHCSLDGAAYVACASPANYTALAGGAHTFSVYAVDAAGNADESPATWAWTVDVTAPDTTVLGGPTGVVATTSATLSFNADDGAATFECRLDGGDLGHRRRRCAASCCSMSMNTWKSACCTGTQPLPLPMSNVW